MKTHKEVTWLMESGPSGGIEYTHEQYRGASEYRYGWLHIPTAKRGESVIFGVTEENGNHLVKRWDNSIPTTWRYFPLNPKFINQ